MVLNDVFVPDHNYLPNGEDFGSGVGRVLEESRVLVGTYLLIRDCAFNVIFSMATCWSCYWNF
jgi:hypothetical protein